TPRAVLLRTGLKPLSTAKPRIVNTARSYRTPVNIFRPRIVNTARSYRTPVNIVRPRVVNTARSNRTLVNVARENGFNVVKPSACWGKPQHDDTGFVDSGCLRHMTGNIAYLFDFKQFDGGYVAFGGGAYGIKITRKDDMGIKVATVSNSYRLRHCLRGGILQEVRTPRCLSLVVPLTKVGDEAVHKELGDRMERAATTTSSLEADGPRCQDTILGDVNAQTRFEITSIQSIDPPLSRGYTLRSGEDSMKLIGIDEILLKLVLSVLVSAVKCMLMLPVQVSAVEVNPVIYTSCIEQFWATAKVQTVNGVRQLQALVDKKRVIVTESSIRRDLHLDDAEGTDCLPTATIFEELARMGSKYIFDAMVKHLDGGVKFLLYPRFLQVFINQQLEMSEYSDHPTDSTLIPIIDQPSSSSQPKKDKLSKKA
ncbi:hypothetical protein Tco_1398889, partial [Tanacetum coccineum]